MIKPCSQLSNDNIFINGKKINQIDSSKSNNIVENTNKDEEDDTLQGHVLKNKDIILFGINSMFIYMVKSINYDKEKDKDNSDYSDYTVMTWEKAQKELQKEMGNNLKIEEELEEKKLLEEIENIKTTIELKYNKEKEILNKKAKQQSIFYEEKIKKLKKGVEKTKVESERLHMQTLIEERINFADMEYQRKIKELEIRENDILKKKRLDKNNKLQIHNSEKVEITLTNLMRKINKMKIILSEFGRKFKLEVQLTKNIIEYFKDTKSGLTILIRVTYIIINYFT